MDGGGQTGRLGMVVSTHAIRDGDFHESSPGDGPGRPVAGEHRPNNPSAATGPGSSGPARLASCLRVLRRARFCHAGVTHPVFSAGEGPGVLIMHEVPGLYPAVIEFAQRVVGAGFRVAMPQLFGTPGRPLSGGYALGQIGRACIGREFHVLASRKSSPITVWLRALCRQLHTEVRRSRRGGHWNVPNREFCALVDGRPVGDGPGALPTLAAVPLGRRAPAGPCIFPMPI